MAFYNIFIEPKNFYVSLDSVLSTDCSDILTYNIYADNGDSIDIELTGSYIEEKYILNGVESSFTDNTTVVFNNSLQLILAVENSGSTGTFDKVNISVTNNTTSNPNNIILLDHSRMNDKEKCNL